MSKVRIEESPYFAIVCAAAKRSGRHQKKVDGGVRIFLGRLLQRAGKFIGG